MPVEVEQGYKFALLALPESRGVPPVPLLSLSDGYAVSQDLPEHALETWHDDIGRFHRNELAGCGFFLWSLAPSQDPEVLDAENETLGRRVYYLFLGVLLATPYFSAGRLTSLTGANADGTTRARSLTTFDRTYWTLGAPPPNVTFSKLKLAAKLATALTTHDGRERHERFDRSMRAFRVACETSDIDERFHQFVRTAEGFAVPANAVQFTDRLASLCKGRSREHLKQIYRIRSGIEHLHGPYDRMPKRMPKRERLRRLLQRTVEAEALARYLIVTYLRHPAMWAHFETRPTIQKFWSLPPAKRTAFWPIKLKFSSILQSFDWKAAAEHEVHA